MICLQRTIFHQLERKSYRNCKDTSCHFHLHPNHRRLRFKLYVPSDSKSPTAAMVTLKGKTFNKSSPLKGGASLSVRSDPWLQVCQTVVGFHLLSHKEVTKKCKCNNIN